MREGNQLLLRCLGYQGDTKVAQDSGDDIVIKTLYSNGLTENNALTPGKALC